MGIREQAWNGQPAVLMENRELRVAVIPGIGGRIVSLVGRLRGREFLWRNPRLSLAPCAPGSGYDPNFYGGIDEMIPCDIPEVIDGISCPDHGELWTLPLECGIRGEAVSLSGRLPGYGLDYRRTMRLDGSRLVCDYRIGNPCGTPRNFLWKLHAALAVSAGDRVVCPASRARAADPAWSRWKKGGAFAWPDAAGLDMSVVPPADGSTEFLFLEKLSGGSIALDARDGARLECRFDRAIFPCCCYFASHGAMEGACTAVLEPCTAMPLSVNDAAAGGFCSRLGPGEAIETTVTWGVAFGGREPGVPGK